MSTNASAIKLSVLTIPQVMPAKSLCFVDFELLAGLTLAQATSTDARDLRAKMGKEMKSEKLAT